MATAGSTPALVLRVRTALGDGYFRLGDAAKARDAWSAALAKFPADGGLKKRLETQGTELEDIVTTALTAEPARRHQPRRSLPSKIGNRLYGVRPLTNGYAMARRGCWLRCGRSRSWRSRAAAHLWWYWPGRVFDGVTSHIWTALAWDLAHGRILQTDARSGRLWRHPLHAAVVRGAGAADAPRADAIHAGVLLMQGSVVAAAVALFFALRASELPARLAAPLAADGLRYRHLSAGTCTDLDPDYLPSRSRCRRSRSRFAVEAAAAVVARRGKRGRRPRRADEGDGAGLRRADRVWLVTSGGRSAAAWFAVRHHRCCCRGDWPR